jgi:hypothetical protein
MASMSFGDQTFHRSANAVLDPKPSRLALLQTNPVSGDEKRNTANRERHEIVPDPFKPP